MKEEPLQYVQRRLSSMRGRRADVADRSGVPLDTVQKVAQNRYDDYKYGTVMKLYRALKEMK